MKYIVSSIKYDMDGEDIDIPGILEIDVPDDLTDPYDMLEFISDEISNITGFCHTGFYTDPEIIE
jgi:hypothetical protein